MREGKRSFIDTELPVIQVRESESDTCDINKSKHFTMTPLLFSTFEVTTQTFYRASLSFAIVNLKPIVPGRKDLAKILLWIINLKRADWLFSDVLVLSNRVVPRLADLDGVIWCSLPRYPLVEHDLQIKSSPVWCIRSIALEPWYKRFMALTHWPSPVRFNSIFFQTSCMLLKTSSLQYRMGKHRVSQFPTSTSTSFLESSKGTHLRVKTIWYIPLWSEMRLPYLRNVRRWRLLTLVLWKLTRTRTGLLVLFKKWKKKLPGWKASLSRSVDVGTTRI